MSELKQKWSALKRSERQMIFYGALCITLFAVYFYVFKPYGILIDNYRQQISYTQEDITWLGDMSQQIKQLKSGSSSSLGQFSGSFINTVDKSIKQNRLNTFVGSLENSGGDKVVVQFNKLHFNSLIKWTGYIKKRYGILVKNIDLQREGDTGQINARLILKKS